MNETPMISEEYMLKFMLPMIQRHSAELTAAVDITNMDNFYNQIRLISVLCEQVLVKTAVVKDGLTTAQV